jgi:hypothetical protein
MEGRSKMNTELFTTSAKVLLIEKSPKNPDNTPQQLSWQVVKDGWTWKFAASWIAGGEGEPLLHDVHVTARAKGQRRHFSVWFEMDSEGNYEAV